MSTKQLLSNVARWFHKYLLLGEEGDPASWTIFLVLVLAYLGFSLGLVKAFGTTLVLEFTRYAHDNAAHLYIARTIIDNGEYSRLANVGTVWLPLYHLVLMPFTIIDKLYVTGLAGAILNAVFVATTASTIYLVLRGWLGLVFAFMYGFSVYSIIHASSSYMVPIGQFLAFAATYYALRYNETGSLRELTKATALAMAASTARYEAWLVLVAITLAVVLREAGKRNWVIVAYVPAMWLGVVGWLIYNWAIFGNPLEFIVGVFPGASGYYLRLINYLAHPWLIDGKLVASVVAYLAGFTAPVYLVAVLVMDLLGLAGAKEPRRQLARITLLYLPLVLLLIAHRGLLILDIPLYFYFLSPWIYVASGELVKKATIGLKGHKGALAALVLLLVFAAGFVAQDTREFHELRTSLAIGGAVLRWQRSNIAKIVKAWHEAGGYIASPISFISAKISTLGDISPRYIVDEYDYVLYKEVSEAPWSHNVGVVLVPGPALYKVLKTYLAALSDNKHYAIRFYEDPAWRIVFLHYYSPRYSIAIDGDKLIVYTKTR